MKHVLTGLLATLLWAGACAQAPGAGHALNFPGGNANPYVTLGSLAALGTANFSVEFWVYADSLPYGCTDLDPALLANKNWASGSNTGLVIFQRGSGELRINFKGSTGPRVDKTCPGSVVDGWHHFAATFDRSGFMRMYLDGLLKDSANIAGSTGTLVGSLPFNIGQDGTGNYPCKFDGKLDELRIWDGLLTLADIRANMCRRVPAASAGLLAYHSFDVPGQSPLQDQTANANNGTPQNMTAANWQLSGAPVGQASVQDYAPGAASVLSLTGASGTASVRNIAGAAAMHLYRVDALPNSVAGIVGQGGNNAYFGVFAVGGTATFNARYAYDSYPLALTNEATLGIYARADNAAPAWGAAPATLFAAGDSLVAALQAVQGEIILGGLLNAPCTPPSNLAGVGTSPFSAQLTWASGSSPVANVEWGVAGFAQGSGTLAAAVSSPLVLSNLQPNTTYAFYVQDTCLGVNASAWVGPATFSTPPVPACAAPSGMAASNVSYTGAQLTWTSPSNASNVQYGPSGFALGTGTLESNVLLGFWALTALQPGSSYDVYVQDTCATTLNASAWVGPYTFATLSVPAYPQRPGAGYAVNFDSVNNFIAVPNHPSLRPDSFITVEAWINARSFSQNWISFLSHAQDNGGNESGYDFAYYGGKLRFRLKTASLGSGAWDTNPGAVVPFNQWVHVAGTYDGDSIKMYMNGIRMEARAATGLINWQFSPIDLRIGMYKDNNEEYYFDGQVDEVRIWKTARTQTQLRQHMCRKLTGAEAGLLAYFRMDEGQGLTTRDLAPNFFIGTLNNMPPADWRISDAALGDTSAYLYTTGWNNATVSLPSPANGSLAVRNVFGDPDGVQLYRNDAQPNTLNGVWGANGNDVYYGVFVVNGNAPEYEVRHGYAGYPAAQAAEDSLELYMRYGNADTLWIPKSKTVDVVNDWVDSRIVKTSAEFFLGVKPKPVSLAPGLDGASLRLQPNPAAQGQTTLAFHSPAAGTAQLTLHDLRGAQVHAQLLPLRSGANAWDLALNLAPGMYTLRLATEAGSVAAKLVVQ